MIHASSHTLAGRDGIPGPKDAPATGPGRGGRGLVLERLKAHIADLEAVTPGLAAPPEQGGHCEPQPPWAFGLAEIDRHLPAGGLGQAAIHEVAAHGPGDVPAALGFATALAVRRLASLADDGRPILWCRASAAAHEWGGLYGHGLEALGLPSDRLLTVRLNKPQAVLWTVEEALKSASLAAVIADAGPAVDFTATRRLMLAAGEGRTPALLVFPNPPEGGTAARSRWIVAARPSSPPPFDAEAPGTPAWIVRLARCRGGRPGQWSVEWSHATHRFALVAAVFHRAADRRGAPAGQAAAQGAGPAAGAGGNGRPRLAARRL